MAPITIKLSGIPITVRTTTPDLEVAINCLNGEFDRLCAAIPALRHRLIIDAGGYIGTAAIAFARRYPNATIVTLELNTANYYILVKNTAAWPNIVTMNTALAPEPCVSILYNRGTGEWGFTLIEKAADCPTSPIETGLKQRVGESGVDLMAYGRTPWS
jgi:hypothetical protein